MYLAVDCETTGLLDTSQVLTAYFIILDDDFTELKTLDLKIKYDPKYTLNKRAMEINQINLEEHNNVAVNMCDAKKLVEDFLKSKSRLVPIGHNVAFDLNILKCNGLLENINIISYFSLDTLTIAQFLKSCNKLPQKQSMSLKTLCDFYGLKLDNDLGYHNAEYDIRMTIELLKTFQKMIK
jgi:DNA polymerase III alpha subunit (gram-positive type)